MKKIWASIVKDVKMAFRNYYVYFTVGMSVIFILLVAFVIPQDTGPGGKIYLYLDPVLAAGNEILDGLPEGLYEAQRVTSPEDLRERLKSDRSAIGLQVSRDEEGLVFTYLLQGYESRQTRNILQTSIEMGILGDLGFRPPTETVFLGGTTERIPNHKNFIPLFLVMESALLGLFLGAAYLFIDKEEGTIKAFAVSPGRVWEYLLSKVIVFMLFSWVSGFLVALFLLGFSFNYLLFALMLMVYSVMATLLGLILAAFFDNIGSAMIWVVLSTVLLGLAAVSYFLPSFSPWYIQLLPTYHMLFGFRDVLFGTGTTGETVLNIALFGAVSVALFFLAERLHRNRLAH